MATRQVTICSSGECQGECYRCRLEALAQEKELYRRAVKTLLEQSYIRGGFGPWSDAFTDSWQWLKERVEDAKELPADFAPGRSALALSQEMFHKRR